MNLNAVCQNEGSLELPPRYATVQVFSGAFISYFAFNCQLVVFEGDFKVPYAEASNCNCNAVLVSACWTSLG